MSVADEILRITTARNTIRDKLVSLGLGLNTYDIEACASAVAGIEYKGAVSAQVKEGETYTIPAGYHNGAGTVAGVAGGGSYTLQEKTVTPTKSQQSVTSDSGYYGLSGVTVNAIPSNYADISGTTAEQAHVLTGKVFTNSSGVTKGGTMPNRGASKLIARPSATDHKCSIPHGYHDGYGYVQVAAKSDIEITPTKFDQVVSASSAAGADAFMDQVTVKAIPAEYITTGGATAYANHILQGFTAYARGELLTGNIPHFTTLASRYFDALANSTLYVDPAYYAGGVSVVLGDEIETALAEI